MGDNKEKNYEEMLYSLTVLYERWLADKQDLNKQIIKIERLTKDLDAKIAAFEDSSKNIRDEVVFKLKETGNFVTRDIAHTVNNHVLKSVSNAIEDLKNITAESRQELSKWHVQAKSSVVWGIVIAVVASFLVSLTISSFFFPTPKLLLTDQQSSYMTGGQIMAGVFPKLTPGEQKHVKELTGKFAQDLLQEDSSKQ